MALDKAIRLQKYLAQCGVCSRRKAEEHIKNGRVSIDGKTVTEMGILITPGKNEIRYNNKPVIELPSTVSYLLNKPKGYVTTAYDPQGRPTVTSFFKDIKLRLFPVGRLDLDTEGALILTNDGALAQKIQHPSQGTKKTYEAVIKGRPPIEKIKQLEKGILLEGKMTAPAKIRLGKKQGLNSVVTITIHEGRKRQIKKMFSFIGHPVHYLKRTAYGKLTLGKLPLGAHRPLGPSDLEKIFL